MLFEAWHTLLASAGISLLLCLLLTPLARKIGLLDHPSERKVHDNSVPLVVVRQYLSPWRWLSPWQHLTVLKHYRY